MLNHMSNSVGNVSFKNTHPAIPDSKVWPGTCWKTDVCPKTHWSFVFLGIVAVFVSSVPHVGIAFLCFVIRNATSRFDGVRNAERGTQSFETCLGRCLEHILDPFFGELIVGGVLFAAFFGTLFEASLGAFFGFV